MRAKARLPALKRFGKVHTPDTGARASPCTLCPVQSKYESALIKGRGTILGGYRATRGQKQWSELGPRDGPRRDNRNARILSKADAQRSLTADKPSEDGLQPVQLASMG